MNTAVQNFGQEIRLQETSSERIPSLIGAPRTIDAWRHERMFRAARSIINIFPKGEWLTIGDGGADGWMLRGLGASRVTASSNSDSRLKQLKQSGHLTGIELRALNAGAIDLPDGSVDFNLLLGSVPPPSPCPTCVLRIPAHGAAGISADRAKRTRQPAVARRGSDLRHVCLAPTRADLRTVRARRQLHLSRFAARGRAHADRHTAAVVRDLQFQRFRHRMAGKSATRSPPGACHIPAWDSNTGCAGRLPPHESRVLRPLRAGRADSGGIAGCSPVGRIPNCPPAAQSLWRRGLSQEFSSPMNSQPGCPTDSFPVGMTSRKKNTIARARRAGRHQRSQQRLELRQ